jgi:ribulose-5-phosphate 4-epimerase/fuculose-1-phosphate aldolase
VLALEGLAEGMLGIVGGRRPGAETFWIKSSDLRLEEVTPESLLCFDLEGKLLAGDRPPHSEIPSGWVGPSPSGWAGPRPCSSSTTAW